MSQEERVADLRSSDRAEGSDRLNPHGTQPALSRAAGQTSTSHSSFPFMWRTVCGRKCICSKPICVLCSLYGLPHHGQPHIPVPVKACRSISKFLFCWCAPSQAPGGFKSDSLQNDVPFTPAICQKEEAPIVGPLDETWVARAWRGNEDEPISRRTLAGVPQNYSPSLFKSRGLACSPYPRVGHAVSQENQLKVLHDSCLLRPLAKCQVFDMCGGTSSAMLRCL
jgi:hypothetical protein